MTRTGYRAIGVAIAVGLAWGLAAEAPPAGAQTAPPIRVGFSSAMTGPSAITGERVKWAAQMLADEYNAKGGIAGRKIELYFGDNAGTPGEAVSAVRKLVDVDKVDVIIGQTHSGACLGALPVVKELQVPMVIEACSHPKIRDQIGKNGNEWAFRVNPDDVMLANQFAKYMVQQAKTVSIFAQNDDFGRGAAAAYDAAFKKVGIKLLSTEFFDRGQADYRPVLTRVKRAAPEGVLLVMLASEGSVFMRQYRELGLNQKLFARGSMGTVEFLYQVRDSPNIADGASTAASPPSRSATRWRPPSSRRSRRRGRPIARRSATRSRRWTSRTPRWGGSSSTTPTRRSSTCSWSRSTAASSRCWRRSRSSRSARLSDLLEQLVHGLTLGSLYAMVATGLALMFGVVRLINFAHGEFYMLGGYAFWYAYVELGLPYPVAGLAAVAAMAVFGLAYERAVIRTILARTWHVQLIATLATSITLTNLAIIVFGTQPKEVPTRLSAAILDVGGVRMAWQRVLVLVSAIAIFAALEWFVANARLGKAMRAMSQNREACAVVGVDVQQVALATFGISAGLAAAAAALVSPLFSIFPDVGALLTLKAFAAVIVGGFGYVRGAIAAAFLIGIAESLAAGYLSYAYKDAIAFVVMVAVLLVRPQGLFGRRIGI